MNLRHPSRHEFSPQGTGCIKLAKAQRSFLPDFTLAKRSLVAQGQVHRESGTRWRKSRVERASLVVFAVEGSCGGGRLTGGGDEAFLGNFKHNQK